MVEETSHRTVTERFADLFRELEQTDAYHIDGAKVEISEQIYLATKRQGISEAELRAAWVKAVLTSRGCFKVITTSRLNRWLGLRVR